VIVGVLLALVTSVSWALGNVYIQKSGKAVGAPRAMLWALSAGGALAGLASLVFDTRPEPFTGAVVGWLIAAGLSGVLAYVCLFHAFERAPLSLAVPIVSSWSLVSGAISMTLLGERLRAGPLVGALVVFAGVLLVSIGGSRPAGGPNGTVHARPGVLWPSFGSALGFGVMVPSLTRVAPATGEFGATAIVYAVGVLMALPVAALARVPLRPPPRAVWGLVLLTGCFETFGFVLIPFARRFAPMTVVTPVSSLASALTVLYAWVVLRERPHPLATAGAVFACLGVVILST
jgi:drug/metabolite transporter (DMT)-like permease